MQTRFLIAALAGCAVLVLGAFWQLSNSDERPQTRIPGRIQLDDISDIEEAPLIGEAQVEYLEPEVLQAPPPAPLLNNDPGRGTVWLRVIDAATNRPLASTDCRMLWAGYQYWGDYTYSDERSPGHARTDADGLLPLTVQVLKEEEEDEHSQVVIDPANEETTRLVVPVPGGFYADVSTWDLGEALYKLHASPVTAPIDVPVRRLASVRVTARDRYGMPIPDAYLRASVLIGDSANSDWIDSFCQNYNCEYDSDWRGEVDELRRDIRRDQVTCSLVGAKPEINADDIPWYSEEAAASDQFGSLSFRNLPCIGVGVLAWHPRYGTAVARMELQSGRNELNVYFREELTCELRIRVNYLPAPEDLVDLDVEIQRTGPQGLADAIADGEDWFSRDWYFYELGGGVHEAVVSGLPPGWWHVRVEDSEWYSGHNIELTQGETRVLECWLGEKAMAEWTPVIRSGGVQLTEASLYLLGGSNGYRDAYEIYHDPEDGETDSLDLLPGTYTAWIPTLAPFTFTLKPGEKRVDSFELLSINVNMTLGIDLAKYLGDPENTARLDLLPVGMWDDAMQHLYALDTSMRKLDENYDLLKPGEVKGWMLPPGEYRWQLYGDNEQVEGRVTFTATGPTSLHFGLSSLPGYAALDVTLIGFPVEDPPSLWLDEESAEHLAVRPASTYRPGPAVVFPGEFEDQLLRNIDVQEIVVSETRVVFFAPAGTMRLSVSNNDDAREYIVTLPSRMTIQANELGRHGFRTLDILDQPEDPEAPPVRPENVSYDEYDIELSAPGWFERAYSADSCDVPHGAFKVRVVRSRFYDGGGYDCGFAEIEFDKGTDDLVLELWELNFRACATLDLEFKGRGSPEKHTDAWWFDGLTAPRLYALDGGQPRLVSITGLSEYMPGGRLEFAIRGTTLPPGRYRLVPWPDAAEKYVREFTLESGRHTTINVQGG